METKQHTLTVTCKYNTQRYKIHLDTARIIKEGTLYLVVVVVVVVVV